MAEGPVLNKGTLANQVCTGIVQYAIPAFGWAMVIPVAGNDVDKPILCMPQANGGLFGAGTISVPCTGTTIVFKREKDTDIGRIISVNPTGNEPRTWKYVPRLRHSQFIPGVTDLQVVDAVIQTISQKDKKKKAVYVGGLQDQFQGDVYTADKKGPGIFYGRAQLTVRGSDLSYIEVSALKDKIYTVTVESQLDTLTDKNTITTKLNKTLKASGVLQGLGGRAWEKNKKPLKEDSKQQVIFSKDKKDPLFRYQHFQGGAAGGSYLSIVGALQEKENETPVLISQGISYDGLQLSLSAQGKTSIKTPWVTGLTENPFTTEQDTEARQKELDARKQKTQELLKKFQKIKLSDTGLQRIAQMDAIVRDDARALIADMLGSQAMELLQNQVEPFTTAFGDGLQWLGQDPSVDQSAQDIDDYPTVETRDAFTGKTVTRFNNNSIITRDPDGTITLKDGWGSQITMSHGNIYISSALDTFIRPGRDLIAMVPRHLSETANGDFQLASKKDIKIGSQKNLVLASAISGEDGYTVLENRSSKQGDMVIRSNGKLTLTASDDMHIGINDKRTVNNDTAVKYGTGSIFIEGQKLRLESREDLCLLGTNIGVYGHSGSTGAGLQISPAAVTMIGSFIQLNTSSVQIGKFNSTYTVQVEAASQKKTITLSGGQGSTNLHVRGRIQCTYVICAGDIEADGMCVAKSYQAIDAQQEQIPKTDPDWYKDIFQPMLSTMFKEPLTGIKAALSKGLQTWYNDKFICDKELKFKNDWNVTKVPTMCWQLQGTTTGHLKKIQEHTTGKDTVTCAYPGANGWNASMFTIQSGTYKADWSATVQNAYTTHTQEE